MTTRIAFDMDEVMADTLGHQLTWLKKTYGYALDKRNLFGQKPHDQVKDEHIAALEAHMHRGDFFLDIPLMPDCAAVVSELSQRYEVFVATAAMDYPKSCHAKFDWLQANLPQIAKEHYVFCGDKAIVHADYLVDDSPRHFARFAGKPLLFEAPHNVDVQEFPRMRSWQDIAKFFLK